MCTTFGADSSSRFPFRLRTKKTRRDWTPIPMPAAIQPSSSVGNLSKQPTSETHIRNERSFPGRMPENDEFHSQYLLLGLACPCFYICCQCCTAFFIHNNNLDFSLHVKPEKMLLWRQQILFLCIWSLSSYLVWVI